jgi:hypothetical protein
MTSSLLDLNLLSEPGSLTEVQNSATTCSTTIFIVNWELSNCSPMWNILGKMDGLSDLSRRCFQRRGVCCTTPTCPFITGVKPSFMLLTSRTEVLLHAFKDYLPFNFAPALHKTIRSFVFSVALLKYIYVLLNDLTLSSAPVANTELSSE